MQPEALIQRIPHRPPFLFVDEVLELGEGSITTRFHVDPGLPFFAGHFPGAPVMPGVLLCECCFQAGAILLASRIPCTNGAHEDPARNLPVVTRILEAKFRRMVQPGDDLTIEVSLDEEIGGAFFMAGKAAVGGEPALRCRFAVTRVASIPTPQPD